MTPALSLAALTVLEVSPIQQVRIARQCGYSHVGLRPLAATTSEPHTPILTEGEVRRELRHVLAGEGVEVLDCEIVRLAPEMNWDEIDQVLDFCAELGAERLLVADNDPDSQRSVQSLARLAALGKQAGVTPCLEFMPWTCSPTLASARERIAGLDGAALLLDAFHLNRSGGTVVDLDANDPAISYLQLCDIAGPVPSMTEILREARSDRLFPGDGSIDLVGLLKRFPNLPVSLEVPSDRLRDSGTSAQDRAAMAATKHRAVLALANA